MNLAMLEPEFGPQTRQSILDALATGFVSTVGPTVPRFEAAFAEAAGLPSALACASGTAAIHLALAALQVGPGDEVWVSDLTFVASVNPIRYCGATPVLVDCEADGWNLDAELVCAELDRRAASSQRQPAAVIVVHLLGHPADLAPIMRTASQYGVPVIEDAAEALGAGWSSGALADRRAGAVGTFGCFSFNGNKTITTGSGGALTSADPDLLARAAHLRQQAKLPGLDYRHDDVGFNYGMPQLSAALGLAQLSQLPEFLSAKRRIFADYDAAFSRCPQLAGPPVDRHGGYPGHWLYGLRLSDEQHQCRTRAALADAGIETRPLWWPVHRQQPYLQAGWLGRRPRTAACSDEVALTALCLPTSSSLTASDQQRVIDVVLAAAELERTS